MDFEAMRQIPEDALRPRFIEVFGDDLRRTERARDLYKALCNQVWTSKESKLHFTWRSAGGFVAALRNDLDLPIEDINICQRCQHVRSEHQARQYESGLSRLVPGSEPIYLREYLCPDGGLFTPGYTGREDYMDYYCSGGEGKIESWVEEKLESLGYSRESEA